MHRRTCWSCGSAKEGGWGFLWCGLVGLGFVCLLFESALMRIFSDLGVELKRRQGMKRSPETGCRTYEDISRNESPKGFQK